MWVDPAILINNEREKRRKLRIIQVREQEKEFARHVRENTQRKRQEEKRILEDHLKEHAIKEHHEQLCRLREALTARRDQIGQAQRDAATIEQEERKLQELRILLTSHQRAVAKKRELAALHELTENQLKQKAAKDEIFNVRSQVLAVEKERSKLVTSNKKKPQGSLLIMDLETDQSPMFSTRRVQGIEAFASTYFHLPDGLVHREATPTPYELNAVQAAHQVNVKDDDYQKQSMADRQEQKVKADLRHKHAMAQVKIEKDKIALVKDLSILAREDRTRRQHLIHKIPTNLFQPVQQQLEDKERHQFELEDAFEKIIHKKIHVPITSVDTQLEDSATSCDSDSGSDGPNGSDDPNGMDGPNGSDGPNGMDGPNGSDGLNGSAGIGTQTPSTITGATTDHINEISLGAMSGLKEENEDETVRSKTKVSSLSLSTITPSNVTNSDNSSSGSISRLVEMIHHQQQVWQDKINMKKKMHHFEHVFTTSTAVATSSTTCSSRSTGCTLTTTSCTDNIVHATAATTGVAVKDISALSNDKPSLSISTISSSQSRSEDINELTIETVDDTTDEVMRQFPHYPYYQPVYYYHPNWYSSTTTTTAIIPSLYYTQLYGQFTSTAIPTVYSSTATVPNSSITSMISPQVYTVPQSSTVSSQVYTVPQCSTVSSQVYTVPQSSTVFSQVYTVPQSSTVSSQVYTVPQASTVSSHTVPQSTTVSPQIYTVPQSSTVSPQIYTVPNFSPQMCTHHLSITTNTDTISTLSSFPPSPPAHSTSSSSAVISSPYVLNEDYSATDTGLANSQVSLIEEEPQRVVDDDINNKQRAEFIQSLLISLQSSPSSVNDQSVVGKMSLNDTPVKIRPPLTSPLQIGSSVASPVQIGSSVASPVQIGSSVASPVQIGSPVASPLQIGSSVASPVQIGSSVASPLQIETSAASPVQIGSSVASPLQIETSAASPVQIGLSVASPVQIGSSVASPLQIGSSVASPVQIGSSVASPLQIGSSVASPVQIGSSVASPLQIRSSAASPVEISESTVVTSNIKSLPTKSLSLQEAFMLKHKEFIEKSKVRVEEIEQKAKERSNIKKTTTERHKMVKFSNPITSSSKQDKCIQPPQRLFASKPEKIPSKEVHQRTERLYSRLPEVEARKKELQRQKDYAKNREKAKDYYKSLRRKKKMKI